MTKPAVAVGCVIATIGKIDGRAAMIRAATDPEEFLTAVHRVVAHFTAETQKCAKDAFLKLAELHKISDREVAMRLYEEIADLTASACTNVEELEGVIDIRGSFADAYSNEVQAAKTAAEHAQYALAETTGVLISILGHRGFIEWQKIQVAKITWRQQ